MVVLQDILGKSAQEAANFKPITVHKHLELHYDLGHLLAVDVNELARNQLSQKPDDYIKNLTRDNVQLLMNKIWELPTKHVDEAVVANLPAPKFNLPRSQRVPVAREPTKWEAFAAAKGIQKKQSSKLAWDDQLQRWIPNYGYKRAAAENEKNWVIEVPQNADPYEDQFAIKAMAKSEKVAKNELQRLRNIARARKVKIPKTGLLNPEISSAKELQTAVTVTRSSTASAGKFQNKLSKEKEAKNVHSLLPGGSRKRKQPPVFGEQEKNENLRMVDTVLSKRPKFDVDKVLSRRVHHEQAVQSDESSVNRAKGGRAGKKRATMTSAKSKKPKSGKGVHKGMGNKGRKRR